MNATRSRSKSSKSSASRKSSAKSRAGAKGGAKTAQQRRAQGSSKKSASAQSRGAKSARSRSGSSRSSASGSASRSRTPLGQAIEILMEDHKKVQTMFRQAERAKKDPQKLQGIVEAACQALTQHSEIEEEHFYPVLRESLKETDLVAEALIEHASAKQLIAELESGDPEDEQYAAMFTVLGEYVKHHIKEEEGEIFPKARRARGDFEPLLQALQARDEAEQAGEQAGMQGTQQRGAQRERGGRRQTGGRRGGGGRGGDQSTQAEAGMESTAEGATGDVEQPRRGRRGQPDETGETESVIRGRDEESSEEGTRGSRQGGR
jgi:hemerythrin superfamily protein